MTPSSCQIQVTVTLQADLDNPYIETEIRKAAVQAIENAVQRGEDNGFSHDLADGVSFGLVAVESLISSPMKTVIHCG